mmetsp:Transcript_45303/g.75057  ORF Transcript_45303/g.75057 Transcript_45303/m.75057 type:complete len:228 (+) Transcript_45303:466-1149(+)
MSRDDAWQQLCTAQRAAPQDQSCSIRPSPNSDLPVTCQGAPRPRQRPPTSSQELRTDLSHLRSCAHRRPPSVTSGEVHPFERFSRLSPRHSCLHARWLKLPRSASDGLELARRASRCAPLSTQCRWLPYFSWPKQQQASWLLASRHFPGLPAARHALVEPQRSSRICRQAACRANLASQDPHRAVDAPVQAGEAPLLVPTCCSKCVHIQQSGEDVSQTRPCFSPADD